MKLDEYIKEREITVIQAAEELGITRGYLYEILGGRMPPGRKLAIKITEWSQNIVKFNDLWPADND
uniref:Putative DNA binding, helix-turn-helix domain containing protein n=1 Tax=viral metagenome TaxID=1070528 RepID=A0A6M3JNK6_9ZZZZ